jgi:hypothetical protein
MADLSAAQRSMIMDLMARAGRRLDGASTAASRHKVTEGEFDNNFDGVVTAIFHVVEAVEVARHGRMRAYGEGEESTVIRAAQAELIAAGIPHPRREPADRPERPAQHLRPRSLDRRP